MSFLPETKNGKLVEVEIPQKPAKKKKRVSYKFYERELKKDERRRKLRAKKKKKPKPNFPPNYKGYIKSHAWRFRREQYYKKYKKACVVCGSTNKIGLHHLSYKNLGREKDEDLVPLCWLHHEKYHEQHGKADYNKTYQYIIEEQEAEELRLAAKNF